MLLKIKPLSVNEAWQGRRFKTPKYKRYERDILMMLRPLEVPKGKLKLTITYGFSNKASDVDNPCKLFVDCLQKKDGFNDRDIYCLIQHKVDVKKGDEFIEFDLSVFENSLK